MDSRRSRRYGSPMADLDEPLARTPEPPYYAVIFTSVRAADDPEAYAATAARMVELAHAQPGFLGIESVRDATGAGITVSYWESGEPIFAWRRVAAHRAAQRAGRERWYEDYILRVARVERAYTLASSAAAGIEEGVIRPARERTASGKRA